MPAPAEEADRPGTLMVIGGAEDRRGDRLVLRRFVQLCRAPQRVLSRDQLLSMSRLHEAEVYDRTIDVQIRRLRVKLEADPAAPTLIVTERGAGYRLACDVETLY